VEHRRPLSEDEVKRELNLASAADSLVHVAQTIRAAVEARVRASAGCGQCRCSNRGEAVVDTDSRNVVRTKRPCAAARLSENIALSGGEAGFVGIVGRNGTAQGVGRRLR